MNASMGPKSPSRGWGVPPSSAHHDEPQPVALPLVSDGPRVSRMGDGDAEVVEHPAHGRPSGSEGLATVAAACRCIDPIDVGQGGDSGLNCLADNLDLVSPLYLPPKCSRPKIRPPIEVLTPPILGIGRIACR